MAWDATRPVPYRRLFKEWLIYAAIMAVIFVVVLRDSTSTVGLFVGLGASLPLYIGLSYVLAKFGYQRKTLAELRTPRATSQSTGDPAGSSARTRPAPTRRTASTPARPARNRPARKRR